MHLPSVLPRAIVCGAHSCPPPPHHHRAFHVVLESCEANIPCVWVTETHCCCCVVQVFRGIPGLSQQVAALSPPLAEWRRFIYCESMVEGQLLGEVDHFPGEHAV
jgi:hypothetical protein